MIVINGGSYYPESKDIDKEWVSQLTNNDLIGFVPSATIRSEEEYLDFFKDYMLNYGLTNIVKIDLYNNWDNAFDCKVIFIAGGNTYKLLDIVNRSGFSQFLLKNYKEKIIVGNSAGAIILGQSIKTSSDENFVGIASTRGLGLVEYTISPHFTNEKKEKLINLSKELNQKIIGIPNHSAIILDENGERIINDVKIF